MPLSKQYGIGVNDDVTHNSSLDVSELINTAAGISRGIYQGEGWSVPPPSSTNVFRPYYPLQRPYFYEKNHNIKLPGYDWSMVTRTRLEWPMVRSDNKLVVRNEIYTKHPDVQRKRIAFKYSFYRLNEPYDQINRTMIFQSHDTGTPGFSILEGRAGWIEFKMKNSSGGNAGTFYFPVAEFKRETWHELTVFITYGTDASGPNAGRVTVWYGDKLARFHLRKGTTGNYTYSKALVNQNSTSAYGVNPNLGTTPLSTVDNGTPVTLFDYYGWNFVQNGNLAETSQKWGFYQSSMASYCYSRDEVLARFESGLYKGSTILETAANCVLLNPNKPEEPLYVPPAQRTYTMYSHMRFAYWGPNETDEDIWKLLNDGKSPIDGPTDFTWNTLGTSTTTTVAPTTTTTVAPTTTTTVAPTTTTTKAPTRRPNPPRRGKNKIR